MGISSAILACYLVLQEYHGNLEEIYFKLAILYTEVNMHVYTRMYTHTYIYILYYESHKVTG